MTETRPAVSPSPRAQLAMDKLMRTAERLYAERGFAGVSMRQISDAAGQRNKSVVQYHFSNRDELIKAILLRHVQSVEAHRLAMVRALAEKPRISLRERMTCLVLPTIEHNIELGTPSWYARFAAQALVEPNLRDYVIGLHVDTASIRKLVELDRPAWYHNDPALLAQFSAMARQLISHMCAELEHDLAHGSADSSGADPSSADPSSAESSRAESPRAESAWRDLGEHLVTALCGLVTALFSLPAEPVVSR